MLLNLTDEQRAVMLAIHQQKCQDQLGARFSDPAVDEKTIRAVINMQGELAMIQYLLEFDSLVLEQAEQEKQRRLQGNDDSLIG